MATTIIISTNISSSSKGAKTAVTAMSAQMVSFPVEGSYQNSPHKHITTNSLSQNK
jgi:hypothetical protein